MNALLLCCALLAFRPHAAPVEPPLLADLAELKLTVTAAAVVESIDGPVGAAFAANPGYKLVVVTLKGTAGRVR